MTIENKTASRRTLVKGAAWAAPVVAASAAVPAYAASSSEKVCTGVPVPSIGQRVSSQFGTYSSFSWNKTDQYTEFQETQFQVRNLPKGVYLKKATTVVWFREKTTSDMVGPGLWPASDKTATISSAKCSDSSCGWSDMIAYKSGQTLKNTSGESVKHWSVAYSWTAVGTPSAGAYNYTYTDYNGCYTALTSKATGSTSASPQATQYRIDWKNVTPTAKNRAADGYWHWTWYELSDGTILTGGSNSNQPTPASIPSDLNI